MFRSDVDYALFLSLLREHAQKFKVAVHAFLLMPDHFQLLLTPSAEGALSSMMQAIGRTYVRVYNNSYGRSGTLWEGRYRSTVLQPETHLLPTMVRMDAYPALVGLGDEASPYPWSSQAHYLGFANISWLTSHPTVWALGNTPFAREARYAELSQSAVSTSQGLDLMDTAKHGWAVGDQEFVASLQKKTDRRLQKLSPGRPTKLTPKALQ
ncbi:transposase [Rhodoferax aquaticus]|uniref:transposase n=1 Tax=Rhodoferax aquaticus TaxID=2527691 RepID=UPI003CC9CB38